MKRLLLALLVLLCATALFASSYTDSFSYLQDYSKYVELYDAINNCCSTSEVDTSYEDLKASLGTSSKDWTVLLKASLNYAHYLLEIAEKKDTKKAKQLISNAEAIYEALEESVSEGKISVPESNFKALKFTCLTIGYLASPLSVSKGLESIKVIDSAFEEYPNEVSIATLYAARKLNAPAIGGGNADEAFRVFSSLLEFIDSAEGANTLPWDRFDIYCNLAKYYEKQKDSSKALELYKKALDVYPKNKSVLNAVDKLEK